MNTLYPHPYLLKNCLHPHISKFSTDHNLQSVMLTAARRSIRPLSTSAPTRFIGNIFGSREAKKKEIIAKQDEYEIDPESKVVFLNKENSPSYKPFDASEDMPDFQVKQWKHKTVRAQEIEETYTKDTLAQSISEAFQELKGESPNAETSLDDLAFRFEFVKLLQQKLGFDINDHTITRAHTVGYLTSELNKVIAHRWSNERNPNAIVLRKEDFELVPNVYLSEELTEEEQKKAYDELLAQAREAKGL